MKIISWNVGRNLRKIDKQLSILEENPDVLCLQEVTQKSFLEFQKKLLGYYDHIAFSLDLIEDKNLLKGARRLGVLVASKFEIQYRDIDEFDIPWRERVLNLDIIAPQKILFYGVYIPPGSSNKWIKIETLEGLYNGLLTQTDYPKIMCGDFNVPQEENENGVITFAQKIQKNREIILRKSFRGGSGIRWDKAERAIFESGENYDFFDCFRDLYPIKKEYSFYIERKNQIVAQRRFDHFFCSKIKPIEVRYLHSYREKKYSDHSPIMMEV